MATLANASQDPWELAKSRFLDDLEPHEKELFNNATLENIYYSTSNINRDDAENSKTRAVVRKLGPLVSAIESYGGAFDTLAQISPQYLSPIWGSIRVLLVVASSHSKFYDKIVDTLGRIGDILPRFRELKLCLAYLNTDSLQGTTNASITAKSIYGCTKHCQMHISRSSPSVASSGSRSVSKRHRKCEDY